MKIKDEQTNTTKPTVFFYRFPCVLRSCSGFIFLCVCVFVCVWVGSFIRFVCFVLICNFFLRFRARFAFRVVWRALFLSLFLSFSRCPHAEKL